MCAGAVRALRVLGRGGGWLSTPAAATAPSFMESLPMLEVHYTYRPPIQLPV